VGERVEVLEHLRRDRPTLRVIVLTGNEDVEVARATLRAGAFDYLGKPCGIDVLAGSSRRRSRCRSDRSRGVGSASPPPLVVPDPVAQAMEVRCRPCGVPQGQRWVGFIASRTWLASHEPTSCGHCPRLAEERALPQLLQDARAEVILVQRGALGHIPGTQYQASLRPSSSLEPDRRRRIRRWPAQRDNREGAGGAGHQPARLI
jgi:CheY-like chemotaxis protein